MEIFEIVDSYGKPTGKIISLEELKKRRGLPNGEFLQVAKVAIINKNNQILLQKRSMEKDVNPGQWGLCGGKLNFKESALSAVVRETIEEIGITLDENELEFLCKYKNGKSIFIIYYIRKDVDIKKCKLQAEEVDRLQYFDLDQVVNLDTEGIEWLEDLKKKIRIK